MVEGRNIKLIIVPKTAPIIAIILKSVGDTSITNINYCLIRPILNSLDLEKYYIFII